MLQEEAMRDELPATQGVRPKGYVPSRHYLLVFTQKAINKIFIRIDTSKANFEGEQTQQHQINPPINGTPPPPPPPASPPQTGPTPDVPLNQKLPHTSY
eukprot:scaffold7374_cov112-Isochrysis_galbana.AAC.19